MLFCLSSPVQAEDGFRQLIGDWQTYVRESGGDSPICFARAVHPAIAEGEILWMVLPKRSQDYPSGFLAISLGLVAGTTPPTLTIDGENTTLLDLGFDGGAYSGAPGTPELLLALQSGELLEVKTADQTIAVSLTGFATASARSLAACGL